MDKDNYSQTKLIVPDLSYLDTVAKSYIESFKFLLGENGGSYNHSQSLELLASISIELMSKIILACDVCKKYKDNFTISRDELKNEIIQEMKKKYKHNLKKIVENIPAVKQKLEIDKIEKSPENNETILFVNQYSIHFSDGSVIYIKDLEGVRYGGLAEKKDVVLLGCGYDEILVFLLKFQTIEKDILDSTKNIIYNITNN